MEVLLEKLIKLVSQTILQYLLFFLTISPMNMRRISALRAVFGTFVGVQLFLFIFFSFLACSNQAFLSSSCDYRKDLEKLLLQQKHQTFTNRFLLVYQLSQLYQQTNEYDNALVFFAKQTEQFQGKDPYGSFYYYLLGQMYESKGQEEVACLYYQTIIREFSDLEINKRSIHKVVLEQLLKLEQNPYLQREYNALLLERFAKSSSITEVSFWMYRMATILEKIGLWKEALIYYQKYMDLGYFNLPEHVTRQDPNIYENIRNKIIFHNSSKNWVFTNLDELINNIKKSIWNFNARQLQKLKNQNNFFIRTWNQQLETAAIDTDNISVCEIDTLGFFKEFLIASQTNRGTSRITFETTFNTESSQKIVYLGSSGWYRINRWYFVFQRVDYPLDPQINSSWEWIGIYLGEKP